MSKPFILLFLCTRQQTASDKRYWHRARAARRACVRDSILLPYHAHLFAC